MRGIETYFKRFTKSKYAITVSSCTAGMHLFYLAKGKKGDEVILPAQTHVFTGHTIELVGKPILLIVNPRQETSIYKNRKKLQKKQRP